MKEVHAEDYHGTDDDMPDAFEDWITNDVQVDDLISYADTWGQLQLDLLKDALRPILEKGGIIKKL